MQEVFKFFELLSFAKLRAAQITRESGKSDKCLVSGTRVKFNRETSINLRANVRDRRQATGLFFLVEIDCSFRPYSETSRLSNVKWIKDEIPVRHCFA